MVEEWISFITNVGFPIAVAVFLLLRQEKKLTELSTSINQLTMIISNLIIYKKRM